MDRRDLLLAGAALALPFPLRARDHHPAASHRTAHAVLARWLGARAGDFELVVDPQLGPGDTYEVGCRRGVVTVRGSTAIAATRGAYDFLRESGGRQHAWSASPVDLPARFPDSPHRRVHSPFDLRQYFNVCTFGYTTVWWDWARWERELDWMALHGINMPLAMSGQEAIWTRLWRGLGLERADLDGFFTGPAFLPWQRMGNVNRHAGPLGDRWMEEQVALQHRILGRIRELGMKPIVPGFSGFVPTAYQRLHPEARVAINSNWAHFPDDHRTHTLNPTDPRFVEIGARFIREYEREFGRCEYYLADSFNELDPPVSATHRFEELATYGAAVYRSIREGNPDATWVMQGWLFHDRKDFWDQGSVQALLRDVPNDRMVILDLSNELFHGWEAHDQFYGKRWLYSVIHSFGGNTPWHGDLGFYATDGARTLNLARGAQLQGYGMAPEGIENNEVVYELMCDAAWSRTPIDLPAWLVAYQRARYGAATPETLEAWDYLRKSIYASTIFLCKHAFQGRPSAKPVGDVPDAPDLAAILRSLLKVPAPLREAPLFRNDLIDLASRHVGIAIDARLRAALAALDAGDRSLANRKSSEAIALLHGLDALLNVREDLRLERWIASSRAWGRTADERDLYERNARLQVTTWGGPDLHDYASKLWSGLVRDFYVMRWEHYFRLRLEGITADEIESRLATLEDAWTRESRLTPAQPVPDLQGHILALLERTQPIGTAVG